MFFEHGDRTARSGWLRELFGHRRRRRERGQRSSVVLLQVSLHSLPNCFCRQLVRAFSAFFWAPFDDQRHWYKLHKEILKCQKSLVFLVPGYPPENRVATNPLLQLVPEELSESQDTKIRVLETEPLKFHFSNFSNFCSISVHFVCFAESMWSQLALICSRKDVSWRFVSLATWPELRSPEISWDSFSIAAFQSECTTFLKSAAVSSHFAIGCIAFDIFQY